MDAKMIETMSTSTIKGTLVATGYLDPYISDNDKEPSWDGTVHVYKGKSKKKDRHIGRVAVQVKGKFTKDLSKEQISYSASVSDLKNYLNDGGVIFFVVYITDLDNQIIYYTELTPIKLRSILKNCLEQSEKTIKLKQFSKDKDEQVCIFQNFLENSHKQYSFSNAKLFSLEELKEQGNLESCGFYLIHPNKKPIEKALLGKELPLYAKIKSFPIPQPLEDTFKSTHQINKFSCKVSVNNKVYYDSYNIIEEEKAKTIQIDSGFTRTFNEEKKNAL